jgi:hypothetical protein
VLDALLILRNSGRVTALVTVLIRVKPLGRMTAHHEIQIEQFYGLLRSCFALLYNL